MIDRPCRRCGHDWSRHDSSLWSWRGWSYLWLQRIARLYPDVRGRCMFNPEVNGRLIMCNCQFFK